MKKFRIADIYKWEMGRCVAGGLLILFASLLPFTVLAEERVYFYHNDHLGSPVVITDAGGSVVWKADYEPFGKVTTSTEAVSNIYKFIGRELDSETGFYYVGARYYDPSIGRFLTQDPALVLGDNGELPLGTSQYLNKYAYSLNNPYRFVDPDGRNPILILGVILGAIEIGSSIYDAYNTVETFMDPNATWGDKSLAVAGVVIGTVAPGGGYGKVAQEASDLLRHADDISSVSTKGVSEAIQAIERHHLLPRQFEPYFKGVGLDIEKYVTDLPQDVHRLKPGGLHTGSENWNKQWREFFDRNPDAGKSQILQYLEKMKKGFGLE